MKKKVLISLGIIFGVSLLLTIIGITMIFIPKLLKSPIIYSLNEDNESYGIYVQYNYKNKEKIEEIIIEDTYEGLPVTNIGFRAFYNCYALTNVKIPSSINTIEEGAFNGCIALESITIPNSVKLIEKYAFYDCNALKTIIFEGTINEWINVLYDFKEWYKQDYFYRIYYTVNCTDGTIASDGTITYK